MTNSSQAHLGANAHIPTSPSCHNTRGSHGDCQVEGGACKQQGAAAEGGGGRAHGPLFGREPTSLRGAQGVGCGCTLKRSVA